MIQPERIQRLNNKPITKGDYVLYWMQASQRAEYNHALEYAVSKANELDKTLLVFFGITDAYPGIVVAMLFVSLPFLVDAAKEGFKEIDPRLENVARSLGASHWRTFREITFPLAFRSIFSGAILCWARGISEFSAVLILAYHPKSAPILLYEKFTSFGLAASRPISVLLISLCLVIFVVLRMPRRRRN